MSNPDAPFGLMPVRYLNGSPWNGATQRCAVSASYATALFIGDPVKIDPTNTNRGTAEKAPYVVRSDGVDGDYIYGVITSFAPNPDNLTQQYRPASTARYCNVVIADPLLVFWIRDDGTAALTKADIGANAIGTFTESGDTITGLSGYELDSGVGTAPTENASNPLIIVGIAGYSAVKFWRSNRRLATGNLLIVFGTLAPAFGGSLTALGEAAGFAVALLIGAVLLWTGYRVATGSRQPVS